MQQKLTNHSLGLIIDFLHINVVHLSAGKRIGLLHSRVSIAIAISISIAIAWVSVRTLVGIMSSLFALETGDGAQVPHYWSRAMLSTISSIAVLGDVIVGMIIPISYMVMSSMGMHGMSVSSILTGP